MRGATAKRPIGSRIARISIHAPHAGRDAGDKYITGSNCISIHAPLAGCDVEHIQHTVWFSPYFNPRAPCGARQGDHLGGTPLRAISIHAPHAGRDRCRRSDRRGKYYFNPRAPCGARPRRLKGSIPPMNFNPRAPCGARQRCARPGRGNLYFNPRAPCGARPGLRSAGQRLHRISIHAPRAGRDRSSSPRRARRINFNPRAPCGARRGAGSAAGQRRAISIHAPRAGRDEFCL